MIRQAVVYARPTRLFKLSYGAIASSPANDAMIYWSGESKLFAQPTSHGASMTDYEQLGVFYLGRQYDLAAN